MEKIGCILGLGNPLLDISAQVSEEFFKKYDLQPNNAILAGEAHANLYEDLVANHSVEYIAGGATQNAIRVAQWMLQGPPHSTTFIGAIGEDTFGQQLADAAAKDSVRTHYMKLKDSPTGTCAVLIDGHAERSLVANISAAGQFKQDHLESSESRELIEKAQVYYMAGFFLTHSTQAALTVAKQSLKDGKTFCMNLAAPFISEFFLDNVNQLMPFVDVLFGNESEALAYAKAVGSDLTDIPKIAQLIAASERAEGAKKDRLVVITQGSQSTVTCQGGVVKEFAVTPIDKSKIVDMNGAGDAFVGGFLSQYVNNKALEVCCEAGHYAAGVIICQNGCTFPEKPEKTF